MGFPGGSESKKSACNAGDLDSIPGSGTMPWRREWLSTPVFLLQKSHGQRTTVHGEQRADRTEQLLLSLSSLSKCTIFHFLTQTPPKLHSLWDGMLGFGSLGTEVKYAKEDLFLSMEREGCCCSVLSRVWLYATPWTVDRQAPLSLGFSRQEYWSGLPFPPPGDLPDPGIKPTSLVPSALAGRFFATEPLGKTGGRRAIIQNV